MFNCKNNQQILLVTSLTLTILLNAYSAHCSTGGGQFFSDLTWSPSNRYLAFKYCTGCGDEPIHYSERVVGIYDDSRKAYWGTQEGVIATDEDLGQNYIANTLGLFSVPIDGGVWSKIDRLPTVLDDVSLSYIQDRRELFLLFRTHDLYKLKIYAAPNIKLLNSFDYQCATPIQGNKALMACIPVRSATDRRLQIVNRCTGKIEYHDFIPEQSMWAVKILALPDHPVILCQPHYKGPWTAYNVQNRTTLPVKDNIELATATQNCTEIYQWHKETFLYNNGCSCIYSYSQPIHRIENNKKQIVVQNRRTVTLYQLDEGVKEVFYQDNAPTNWEYILQKEGKISLVKKPTRYACWGSDEHYTPCSMDTPEELFNLLLNPFIPTIDKTTCKQRGSIIGWEGDDNLLYHHHKSNIIYCIRPMGLISEWIPTKNQWVQTRNQHGMKQLETDWIQSWQAKPIQRYFLSTPTRCKDCYATRFPRPEGFCPMMWLREESGKMPMPKHPSSLQENPESSYIFGNLPCESYQDHLPDSVCLLFRHKDDCLQVLDRIKNSKLSFSRYVRCQEVGFLTNGQVVGQTRAEVFYCVWSNQLWRVDLKNNDVELAFPFWLNEYSATSDGQKMAAVVTAGYIATQIVIFDFLEERYYRAVPDHRQF